MSNQTHDPATITHLTHDQAAQIVTLYIVAQKALMKLLPKPGQRPDSAGYHLTVDQVAELKLHSRIVSNSVWHIVTAGREMHPNTPDELARTHELDLLDPGPVPESV